jgi:hypothetical protein
LPLPLIQSTRLVGVCKSTLRKLFLCPLAGLLGARWMVSEPKYHSVRGVFLHQRMTAAVRI